MGTGDGLGAPNVTQADMFSGPTGPDVGKRKGIDDMSLGNLIHPSAGYYGGQQGMAESEEADYARRAAAADQRQAPTWNTNQADLSLGYAQAARTQGVDALTLARNAAYGNAPSAANYQQQASLQSALANQYAAANAGGRMGLGASQYGAGLAGVGQMGGIVNQGANARAAEMQQAMGQYGALAGGVRGQDLTQRGQSQQMAYQQAQQQLQQTALNDARRLAYENTRQKTLEEQDRNRQWAEEENANDYLRQMQADTTNRQMDHDQTKAEWTAGAKAASTVAGYGAGAG